MTKDKVIKEKKHNRVKEISEQKIITLVNGIYRDDAEEEMEYLHRGNDGFITLSNKYLIDNKEMYSQWHFPYIELIPQLENFMSVENVYASMNGFCTTKRSLHTIRHINAFWVDLDYYNIPKLKNKTTEEMIELLRGKKLFNKIGEPSFFVDSGKGMYLIWLIKDCSKHMLGLWQVIQNKLFESFKNYGADASACDCTRILRIAGTINSKTGRRSRFIFNNIKKFRFEQKKEEMKIYTIQEMSNSFLDKLPMSHAVLNKKIADRKKAKAEKTKKANMIKTKMEKEQCKVKSLFNIYTLNFARMEDIKTLVELRKGDCELLREFLCFLYRYYSCCYLKDAKLALEGAKELNKMFLEPIPESEVINATRSAETQYKLWDETFKAYLALEEGKRPGIITYFREKKCFYVFSNKYLIKKLEITKEEMVQLKTIINTKEKNRRSQSYRNEWKRTNRRNENGLTTREQGKEDNIFKIEEMLAQGVNKTEIAHNLGINRSLVYRYISEINNRNIEAVENDDNEVNSINEMFNNDGMTDMEAIIC